MLRSHRRRGHRRRIDPLRGSVERTRGGVGNGIVGHLHLGLGDHHEAQVYRQRGEPEPTPSTT